MSTTDLTRLPLEGVIVDPPKAITIFGREPAAWLGLIEAVLGVALAFGLGISQDTFGPIMAVVSAMVGVYSAWATKDTMLGVIVGLVKALVTLVAVYGLTLSDSQVGAVLAVTAVVVAFVQRSQTSPVIDNVAPADALPPIPDPTEVEGVDQDASLGDGTAAAGEQTDSAQDLVDHALSQPYQGKHAD
ncbi:hypothetical protein [Intrasporangium flavum]|uniref:hypothetical protein n=1 Tax=Intrasporangium flavum TaxID=1428657 RepID=UPI00096BD900|nr:hypothetical protein [Intrasporangium flavum]